MKTKIIKILTLASCGYLILLGIMGLSLQFPKDLNFTSVFLSSLLITKSTYIIYITLAVFVIIKVIIVKNHRVLKTASFFVGLSGVLQIAVIINYVRYLTFTLIAITDRPTMSIKYYLGLSEYVFKVLLGLLMIFIFINTFKQLAKNKMSFVLCAIVFASHIILTQLTDISMMNFVIVTNIRYLINTLFIPVLVNISLFAASYYGLRNRKMEYNGYTK